MHISDVEISNSSSKVRTRLWDGLITSLLFLEDLPLSQLLPAAEMMLVLNSIVP